MKLKYLSIVLLLCAAACRTTTTPSLKEDELEFKPKISFMNMTLTAESFKDFNPGKIETNASFPRLYVLLPKLMPLGIEQFSISGKIRSADSKERSIAAQFGNDQWQSIERDIPYISEGLLGLSGPKLELILTGQGFRIELPAYNLNRDSVINPFVDLQLLTIEFSTLEWHSKDSGTKARKILSMSLVIYIDEEKPFYNQQIRADAKNSNGVPSPLKLLMTKDQFSKLKVKGQTTEWGADGKSILQRKFSLGKINELIAK